MKDSFKHTGEDAGTMKQLRLVAYCPVCHASYDPAKANVVREQGKMRLMHLYCKSCHRAILSLVMHDQAGISSFGMVTDLTRDDVDRFIEAPEIQADDCLRLYEALQDDTRFFSAVQEECARRGLALSRHRVKTRRQRSPASRLSSSKENT